MSRVDDIQAQISATQATSDDARARSAEVADQIGRLKAAVASVEAIRDQGREFASWASSYDVGPTWQGNRREEFERDKADAASAAGSYDDAVDEACQRMRLRITELEAEQHDLAGIIQNACSSLDTLGYQLRAAWAAMTS